MSNKRNCSIVGCQHRHYAWDYCRAHYRRWLAHGDPLAGRAVSNPRRRLKNGYVQKRVDGKWVYSHRHEMEKHLGRALVKGETVHHKDGVRNNNNFANLQLMVSHHPPGQRPEDLLVWAKEVLRRYEPTG